MKKLILLLSFFVLTKFVNSQTYGGEIQARNNSNAIGKIGRQDVNLKVYDSAVNGKLPSGLTVTSTRLLVDGSGVTQPVSGTFWQATQPVSAASLPLPTGASTLAEQQTQTTALQLIDNLPNTIGSTTSGQSGALAMGAVTTAAPTYTTAQTNPLSLQTDGSLRTAVTNTVTVGTHAVTQSGTWVLGANSGVDIGDVTINNASGGSAVNIQDGGNTITVDNGGTFAVQAAQSGTWTVQPGNTANTTPWLVTQTPATSGGLTTYHLVSAGTTNATNIKASAGQVFGWYIYNNNAAARKVAFHNTSGTPTAGSSVFFSLVIPASSGANVELANGIAFSSGIGITTVTGVADSNSTAVAADDLIINIFYK